MDELDARLRLLEQEIGQLQESIRAHDSIVHQIKGWAVTVALASAGYAISTDRPAVAVVGIAATLGFWLIDAQARSVQRRAISRALGIENSLATSGIVQALTDGHLGSPGMASALASTRSALPQQPRLRQAWSGILNEARRPLTSVLYLGIELTLLVVCSVI